VNYLKGILFACIYLTASNTYAAINVEEHILQKGIFVKADCKADKEDPSYNACECESDIRYPEIKGMVNEEAQKTINGNFKRIAEQTECQGTPKDAKVPADKNSSASSVSHHYEITFESPAILGLRFTDWGYTGGAHGNGSVEGVIIDLEKGMLLSIGDIFNPKQLPAVNQAIYDALSSSIEEAFREQLESRKDTFIEKDSCQGCALTLMPDGVHIVFQTYELASFAEGNKEVAIPKKFISYPAIVSNLK
jgi:hypothetical protein